jgi:carbonic anhydrase
MITLDNESRKLITPQKALELLKKGNERFVNNLKANRNLLSQMNDTSEGQFPFAIILSCIDSRTSAELIFDQGLGDIFSCRIAGNIINDDIIGSMEFACKVAGAKLIMVLGHTKCGAIKGACDNVKLGSLTGLLDKIQPAIDLEKDSKAADRNSENSVFVENVASLNVGVVIEEISKKSPILSDMIKKGEITVSGGVYDVGTGAVKFL